MAICFNEEFETLPRPALEALQLTRLRNVLERVYANVPFYRTSLDAAGVRPADVTSLADLHRLPFTTKQDMRDSYPYGLFAAPLEEIVRIHASSGTTGKPTVVGYTRKDIENWSELMARSFVAAGPIGGISSTTPTATVSSPAAWGPITAPSGWAPRSSPSLAATPGAS